MANPRDNLPPAQGVFLSEHIHILGICGTFMGGVALLAGSQASQSLGLTEMFTPDEHSIIRVRHCVNRWIWRRSAHPALIVY